MEVKCARNGDTEAGVDKVGVEVEEGDGATTVDACFCAAALKIAAKSSSAGAAGDSVEVASVDKQKTSLLDDNLDELPSAAPLSPSFAPLVLLAAVPLGSYNDCVLLPDRLPPASSALE